MKLLHANSSTHADVSFGRNQTVASSQTTVNVVAETPVLLCGARCQPRVVSDGHGVPVPQQELHDVSCTLLASFREGFLDAWPPF